MARFLHHDLRLLNPTFSSPLVDVLTELEHLGRRPMQGTTPLPVFLQLKQVFHYLESLASARIEGNHTTLADYVEAKVSTPADVQGRIEAGGQTESLREISNIEVAMQSLENSLTSGDDISEHLLRGLHAATVSELSAEKEGDRTPGAYRMGSVSIAQADHLPPEAVRVPEYMSELVAFINRADAPKYALMKVALAHHRFAWIHPFSNGNGRVVRLLTYAMLLKYGFQVSMESGAVGRLLNPAAVFCTDRQRYYSMLSTADSGTDGGLEAWCTYVLSGVRDELRKVDQLADHKTLQSQILLPAVAYARQRELVTAQEELVLNTTIKMGVVKAADLSKALPGSSNAQRTYQIRKLLDAGLLRPIHANARQYVIGFSHNLLLRGVVRALAERGFIPAAVVGAPSPRR